MKLKKILLPVFLGAMLLCASIAAMAWVNPNSSFDKGLIMVENESFGSNDNFSLLEDNPRAYALRLNTSPDNNRQCLKVLLLSTSRYHTPLSTNKISRAPLPQPKNFLAIADREALLSSEKE